MYFWQKTGFKIGVGVAIVAAVVSVTLFSDQIGNLLSLFGSKAGVSRSVVWGNFINPWNNYQAVIQPEACIIVPDIDGGKLTLCPSAQEDPAIDTDGDGTGDGVDIDPLNPIVGGITISPSDTTDGTTETGGTTSDTTTADETTSGDTTSDTTETGTGGINITP